MPLPILKDDYWNQNKWNPASNGSCELLFMVSN